VKRSKGTTKNSSKEICSQELSLHFSADVILPDFDGLEYLWG